MLVQTTSSVNSICKVITVITHVNRLAFAADDLAGYPREPACQTLALSGGRCPSVQLPEPPSALPASSPHSCRCTGNLFTQRKGSWSVLV